MRRPQARRTPRRRRRKRKRKKRSTPSASTERRRKKRRKPKREPPSSQFIGARQEEIPPVQFLIKNPGESRQGFLFSGRATSHLSSVSVHYHRWTKSEA